MNEANHSVAGGNGSLTDKQAMFVKEYMVDLNATQAAIRAGYSESSAQQIGSENMSKPVVRDAVQRGLDERSERLRVDADWVLKRLTMELEADLADLFQPSGELKPVHEWPEIWRQGLVSSFDVHTDQEYIDGEKVVRGAVQKVRLSDRLKRLELIGKHVGVQAFKDKVEVEGKVDHAAILERARKRAEAARDGED